MNLLAASSRTYTSVRRLLTFRSLLVASVAVAGPATDLVGSIVQSVVRSLGRHSLAAGRDLP